MAPGEPTLRLTKNEWVDVLSNMITADEKLNKVQTAKALQIAAGTGIPETAIEQVLQPFPADGLPKNEFPARLNELDFEEILLTASTINQLFTLLELPELFIQDSGPFPILADPTPEHLFSRIVYDRGALTLHALRLKIGDELFFNVLRTYAERFRNSNATTEDFVAIAEEISGQELDEFFDEWLYQVDLPDIPEMGLFREDFVP
jgi:hypothetical protein